MKIKYLYLFAILPLLSGCGVYSHTRQMYDSQNHVYDTTADINAYSVFGYTTESKRILIFYWSDFNSAPFRFIFNVHSEDQQPQPLLIHSVKITSKDRVIWDERPLTPISIKLEKGEYDHQYKAVLTLELGDKFVFREGMELESQVEWEISGTKKKQILKTQFRGNETKNKCSIWRIMQGI